MDLGLFYEIPVPKPWDAQSELRAYRETIDQAVLGDQVGFHSFWTVEHHFLEEFSHCSNPEVLYGAIAALTTNLRIGYGVRLLPKPYNHPVRTAESVAVLDLVSNGRVEFGTGRSSTRMELEGFGVDPHTTREMWAEALECIVAAWKSGDEFTFDGEYWKMPVPRRVVPTVLQDPHPPIWAATASVEGHRVIGEKGIGLLSFTLGVAPEELAKRIEMYREGLAACTNPVGDQINDRAATFAMMHCAPTSEEAYAVARESMEWYPARSTELFGSLASWMEGEDLGNYSYLNRPDRDVATMFSFDAMIEQGWIVVGDPDDCIEAASQYADVGVDLMLCCVNPHSIPHEKVMQSIELLGNEVIPALAAQ